MSTSCGPRTTATFSEYAEAVSTQLPPRLYADLVGKPFADGGRGPDVYDCVGLAAEIQRRRGRAVPDFYSSEAELHRQIAEGGFLASCQRLSEPEPGCVVLIDMREQGHHLGTMVSRYRMVHTTAQTKGVVVESILGPLWVRRIVGFYRLGSSVEVRGSRAASDYPDPDDGRALP